MREDIRVALDSAGVAPASVEALWEGDEPPIFVAAVPGASALTSWSSLRARAATIGHWPLLLGGRDSLDSHRELAQHEGATRTAIAKASEIDVGTFFRARLREQEEYGELPRGEWPTDVDPSNDFSIHQDIVTRKPLREVYLALVPTTEPALTPAFMRFGGWNECPFAEEHVAVHMHWQAKYGAEILGISRDTIECAVSSPPVTREAAIALAEAQYAYAADIVDQGMQSIEALAAALLNGRAWFFWWD